MLLMLECDVTVAQEVEQLIYSTNQKDCGSMPGCFSLCAKVLKSAFMNRCEQGMACEMLWVLE